MLRDAHLYLDDIVAATDKILRYLEGASYESFLADERTYDAVLRNLEIIGEAVKGLPAEFRAKHPSIEWRKIAGMRDILAHGCFSLDNRVLWDAIQHKLPGFLEQVRSFSKDAE